ncbi:hypothetical protein D9615_007151 [Tricholomella constricta]|uniref:F-box domain-containing protein n=1 Tax=Tricholomella constricta TaxID=117010 RepID=A0A8H5H876_9AGAR|nr:hypothetical protein D9615_007151 [Tricholomella constricta]
MPPELPQELIILILSSLFHVHDKPTLSSCSLVCKAWLSLSRTHLFHDLTLNNRNHPQLLSSPHVPTLSPYTRRLKIANLSVLPSGPGLDRFSAITSLMLQYNAPSKDMLLALPLLFPEVRTLYLDTLGERVGVLHLEQQYADAEGTIVFPSRLPASVKGGGLGYGGGLRVLRLYGLCIRDAVAIGAHLGALAGGLEHLELGFVEYDTAGFFHGKIDLSPHTNLRSFSLFRAPPKLFLSALQSGVPLQKLEEAMLTMHSMRDDAQIIRVLTSFDWASLDALTGDALCTPRLHNVTLRLEGSMRTRVHGCVKGGMRMSVGRNVLECRFVKGLRDVCEWEEQMMQDPIEMRGMAARYGSCFMDMVSSARAVVFWEVWTADDDDGDATRCGDRSREVCRAALLKTLDVRRWGGL